MPDHALAAHSVPVVHSVLSAPGLAADLLHHFAIRPVVSCKLLHHNLNDLYLITTHGARYVLRLGQARGRLLGDVLFEVDLLEHLQRAGIPVAGPVPLRDGGFVRRVDAPEGPRHAVLFTYAPGIPLSAPDQDEQTAQRYGLATALLHSAADDLVSPHSRFRFDASFLFDEPLSAALPLLDHRPKDRHDLVALAAHLKTRLWPAQAAVLDVGPCHGDLTGANASLAADGSLTFFDFEFCGLGSRAYDLATYRWGAAMARHHLGVDDEARWSSFLAGYRAHRTIGDADLEVVPAFVAARHVWYVGLQAANWDYWGLGEVDDAFFDGALGFLHDWSDAHGLRDRREQLLGARWLPALLDPTGDSPTQPASPDPARRGPSDQAGPPRS